MIIIGIDPGIANSGFACVEFSIKSLYKVLDTQIIKTPANMTTGKRLETIALEFVRFVNRGENYMFEILAIEDVFFGKNVSSARQTAKVIGALELTAHQKFLKECDILTPTAVKKGVGVKGNTNKDGIGFAIANITGTMVANNHEADAVAVAISAHKLKGGE